MSTRAKPSDTSPAALRTNAEPKPLRVALAGMSGVGSEYRSALQADAGFDLMAVGDADGPARRAASEQINVATYEDLRSMFLESNSARLDLLVVALHPHQSREVTELAGQSGVAVLHNAPFARTVSEAVEVLLAFPDDGPRLFVPRLWHYEPAFTDLHRLFEAIGPVHAAAGVVMTTGTPVGWRGDSARAGGGVLLNGAYACLDLIVEVLGVPERVQAEASHAASSGGPRPYDTEDAVILSFRFGRDRIGTLTAIRGTHQDSWRVSFHGAGGTVDVSNEGWTLTPLGDDPVRRRPIEVHDYIAATVRAFGAARRGEARKLPTQARDHIPTLATIDAAYLSMRTGAPESPQQFLERHSAT